MWLVRSTDLTPVDFLWGCIKEIIMKATPNTRGYEKSNARDFHNIPPNILTKVVNSSESSVMFGNEQSSV